MNKRNIFLGLFFLSLLMISCEEDDVCVGEGTPYLTVVFRNPLDNANFADTITIVESKTPDFNEPDTIYNKIKSDSIKLPLGGLDDDVSYFSIKRINSSVQDILRVNYNTKSNFVSKACGFRITYDNLNYETTFNQIENIKAEESRKLEDESKTNLYIIYSN